MEDAEAAIKAGPGYTDKQGIECGTGVRPDRRDNRFIVTYRLFLRGVQAHDRDDDMAMTVFSDVLQQPVFKKLYSVPAAVIG